MKHLPCKILRYLILDIFISRMHSSRMRNARFSGRLYRVGVEGGGCLPLGAGGVLPLGSGGGCLPLGLGGGSLPLGPGGCFPLNRGGGGVYHTPPSQHPPFTTIPTPCGPTNSYENITFPQTSFAGGENKLK